MEKIVAYFANGMTIAGFVILYAAYSGTLYKAVSYHLFEWYIICDTRNFSPAEHFLFTVSIYTHATI